jgi:phage recombination protein Bet
MGQDLTTQEKSALGHIEITPEQVSLVKATVFKDATDDELKLYFFECRRRGVHPLDRLIHPVVRKDKDGTRRVAFQTSIDLFRSEAENTGEYRGQSDVEYGKLIAWDKVDKQVPEWARATIKRYDPNTSEAIDISAIAYWEEYYPGELMGFQWRKMPRLMLGKCAEALALRKAFPRKLAGLYTFEEMQLTDLVKQGKEKPALKPPQEKTQQAPASQQQAQQQKEETTRDKLIRELKDYCKFADGTVDETMLSTVLTECSSFKMENGNTKSVDTLEQLEATDEEGKYIVSDRWVGSVIGKLRKRVKAGEEGK